MGCGCKKNKKSKVSNSQYKPPSVDKSRTEKVKKAIKRYLEIRDNVLKKSE
jgi:hypothetical protein|tara:strand:+ start:857 stop:1009 length:153 start_codon:yes stop_codon:yes gene_type:complete